MMNLKEIYSTADALANMLHAGMSITKILERLERVQPKHAAFWLNTRNRVLDGRPLSDSFPEIWPMDLVNAIKAGEQSGKLDETFSRIAQATELRLKVRSSLLKLIYPLGWGLGGVGVFILYMLFVLPSISIATGKQSTSGLMQLSRSMSYFIENNWMITLIVLSLAVIALILWLKTPEAQAAILNICLQVPYLNVALRDLYFGLWAQYMAMMASAGLPTTTGLMLTETILPVAMRNSITRFRHDLDVLNLSISDAADPAKLSANDDRVKWWPFYISQAFIIADSTGRIDNALLKVGPSLIKEGNARLESIIKVSNVIALGFAAALIVAPMGAYYLEMASTMNSSGF